MDFRKEVKFVAAKAMAESLNEGLAALEEHQRVQVFEAVAKGFCRECGWACPSGRCYCSVSDDE